MVVEYHLGGRLGHGMWSSVVGWIFGTVENKSTPARVFDPKVSQNRRFLELTNGQRRIEKSTTLLLAT